MSANVYTRARTFALSPVKKASQRPPSPATVAKPNPYDPPHLDQIAKRAWPEGVDPVSGCCDSAENY